MSRMLCLLVEFSRDLLVFELIFIVKIEVIINNQWNFYELLFVLNFSLFVIDIDSTLLRRNGMLGNRQGNVTIVVGSQVFFGFLERFLLNMGGLIEFLVQFLLFFSFLDDSLLHFLLF